MFVGSCLAVSGLLRRQQRRMVLIAGVFSRQSARCRIVWSPDEVVRLRTAWWFLR